MSDGAGGETAAPTIASPSLTEATATRIKAMIISGELAFGQHLAERRLSEQFGISKTPIREAMLMLAAEGLIEIRPRYGTFVFSLTDCDIAHVTEVRWILENGALRAAMRHDAAGLIAALRKNLVACENLTDGENASHDYRRLDENFHALFFDFADNPYLVRAYELISCKVRAMRNRLTFPLSFIRASLAQHSEILRLLEEAHVGQAAARLDYHIAASFTQRAKHLLADHD
jgi:DNA-binding GntR family transcriptional regulator